MALKKSWQQGEWMGGEKGWIHEDQLSSYDNNPNER